MNHIYRVVWNKSQQCWVVVSEFGKGCSKACAKLSNKQVLTSLASTVLLSVIALPSAALAIDVLPDTVTGVTEKGVDIAQEQGVNGRGSDLFITPFMSKKTAQTYAYTPSVLVNQTVTDETVTNGLQEVWGVAINSILEQLGRQDIYAGGKTNNATIRINAVQAVLKGGESLDTLIDGGSQHVAAGGLSKGATLINDGRQSLDGGEATNTTINGGVQSIDTGGKADVTEIKYGYQVIYLGGKASKTTLGGPNSDKVAVQQVKKGGIALDTTVNKKGGQEVHQGGEAQGVIINDGGNQNVLYGGTATDVVINQGGIQYNSGSVSDTTINQGGRQNITGGSALGTIINGGFQEIKGGIATDTLIEQGGTQWVLQGSTIEKTTINRGGLQKVYSLITVTDTLINGGTQELETGTSATNTEINQRGYQMVGNAATALDTTINSGQQVLGKGSKATNTTINTDGAQWVAENESLASGTTINGGQQHISGGGAAHKTIINQGGRQSVSVKASATDTTINQGGEQIVSGREASAIDTAINQGGTQFVTSFASVVDTIINGGTQNVSSNGIASGSVVNQGGVQNAGVEGFTNQTVINQGGKQVVWNKGTATGTSVNQGGALHITVTDDKLHGTLTGVTTVKGELAGVDLSGNIIADGQVTNNGELFFMQTGEQNQNLSIDGSGSLTKAGDNKLILSGNNTYTGQVNIISGILQITNLNNLASTQGQVNLEEQGVLSILKDTTVSDDIIFTRSLNGNGELLVNLGEKNRQFSFHDGTAIGNFSGKVTMVNGRFILDNKTDALMANATLALQGTQGTDVQGNIVLTGEHSLGGLILDGGRLNLNYSTTDHHLDGFLSVNTLDVSGGGYLAVTPPPTRPNPLPITGLSLFDQDDGIIEQVVSANTVDGYGSQLQLIQSDDTPFADDTLTSLLQNGIAAGNAHYNYTATVKDDGIYLGYGLTQLDAFAGQSIILDNSHSLDNSLGAKLTGDGGFTINAQGTVRIGNAASDYLGTTNLNAGHVLLITDNALGQTSELAMQSDTSVDFNGNSQTVGQLHTQSGSLVNINGGELTVDQGGTVNGQLTGNGKLSLNSGTLLVTQNNSSLNSEVEIGTDAIAHLMQAQGLGQNTINLTGVLKLDGANGTLANAIRGNGDIELNNAADISLFADNSHFSGQFMTNAGTSLTATEAKQLGSAQVSNEGTLVLDTGGHWELENQIQGSGTLIKRGFGTLQIDGTNVTAGQTRVENGLLLISSEPGLSANLNSQVFVDTHGVMGGYGTVTGDVENKGSIAVGQAQSGTQHGGLTIDGDYTGRNGKVVFNTQLAGDNSATDKLIITGNTSGHSDVVVTNAKGAGELTTNGIKLIEVGGSSSGKFSLSGRAVAGAYEYFLYQGGITSQDDGDWYLRSALNSPSPEPNVYRPEGAGYMANMAAAGNLFKLRLEDREGRAENSSLWLRQVGSRTKHRDTSGQLRTATNSYVVQGGGEVWGTEFGATDRLGLGIMMAYGKADSKIHSYQTGYRAKSSIDGYSVGIYGTWYQDMTTLNGLYMDSWLQYSWLDAQVNGDGMAKESYDIDGYSASLEAGYRMPVYQGINGDVFLTPQGQITWNGIKPDNHRESDGKAYVTGSGKDSVQTRLGMKISRDGVSDGDKNRDKLFTVYAEANWLYNNKLAGAVIDGVEIKQAGSRNIGELKLGTEGQLNKNLNLWSNVSQQLGDKGYSDTALTVGFKYKF